MTNALVVKNPETLLSGPLGSLDAYIERVSQIPVLSRESELELATRFHRDNDLDAARQLVLVAPAFRGPCRARLHGLWAAGW